MVAALYQAGEQLVVPEDIRLKQLTKAEFENFLTREAGRQYDNYGAIAQHLLEQTGSQTPAEAEQAYRERMESRMSHVLDTIRRLTSEVTGDNG